MLVHGSMLDSLERVVSNEGSLQRQPETASGEDESKFLDLFGYKCY